MRHRVKGKKLNRDSGHRKALRRNLALSVFENGRITTTKAKAQFARAHVERMITIAKRGLEKYEDTGDRGVLVSAQRLAASRLNNRRDVVQKLFEDIAPRFADRDGGYTRILKLGPRKGDQAEMVLLELTERGEDD